MAHPSHPAVTARASERGSALILALMVAVVLAALGLGLLLQTSLGQQAAGTDRHLIKSIYAADAGLMMQIAMIRAGQVSAPTQPFVLDEDPAMPGFFRGRYEVTIPAARLCEAEYPQVVLGGSVSELGEEADLRRRTIHIESTATRTVGMGNLGTTRATVMADVIMWPFDMNNAIFLPNCY